MSGLTRRSFLKDVGAGMAAFSIGAESLQATAMPGRPLGESVGSAERRTPNIMAIAAAPGDVFFAMAAPVALAIHQGSSGSVLSLTLGERGNPAVPSEKYGEEQLEATRKAAAMIGATAEFLHYPDGEVPVNDDAKFAVCDLIRQYKPEIVVTHWRGSWHKDHRACYEIVVDAIFYASLIGIERKLPAHSIDKLFFNDNWEDASGFVPDTYLDITPVYDRWFNACAAFPMWRGETGFRYNDYYAGMAVARGCLANFQKAVALMSPADQSVRRVHAL